MVETPNRTPIPLARVAFVGGSMHDRVMLVAAPRPGRRLDTPMGERYYYDPMSNRYVCRWPPFAFRGVEADRLMQSESHGRRGARRGPSTAACRTGSLAKR
jgi:hypothetical protein